MKNVNVMIRMTEEEKELLQLLVENSPQATMSELLIHLMLDEAVRMSCFDKVINEKLQEILPSAVIARKMSKLHSAK